MPTNTVHTNYEIGFGSSHATPEVEYADMGFGAPFTITITNPFDEVEDYIYRNVSETGHGDPYAKTNFYLEGDKTKFSDDGGEIAIIRGRFKDLLRDTPARIPIGPFQIDFISVSTGDEYRAYSGVPQARKLLFTTINQDKLYVCLPIMPKGLYNIRLLWGEGFINKAIITNGIEIIHRNRFDKAISVRQGLPAYTSRGETSDNIVPSQPYKTESNLAVFSKAFAELCDYAFPNAYTVLTDDIYRGQTTIPVETTLRFEDEGYFWIKDQQISYTGKTNTSFTGCSGVQNKIDKNERVETRERNFAEIPNFILRRHDDLKKPKWAMLNTDWDNAFLSMHYGERASMAVNFQYFYHLFKNVSPTDTGTYVSASRQLQFIDPDFVKDVYSQKYCRIDGKTYHIEKVDEVSKTITLTEYGCAYWNAAPKFDTNVELKIEILPFWIIRDSSGLFRVEIEGTIFNDQLGFIDKDYIDLNIYLGDADLAQNESALLRHLAAGVRGEVLRRDFFGERWPLSVVQDIRDPLLVIQPTRNLT